MAIHTAFIAIEMRVAFRVLSRNATFLFMKKYLLCIGLLYDEFFPLTYLCELGVYVLYIKKETVFSELFLEEFQSC